MMSNATIVYAPYRQVRQSIRDGDLLLFRRRGLIAIAGRGTHSHAAKAAWWGQDLQDWQPRHWHDLPPRAVAEQPIDNAVYGGADATVMLEAFNELALSGSQPIWAVAVPVTIRYEGDALAGQQIHGFALPPTSGFSA